MFKSIVEAIIAIFGFGTAVTKAAEKGMDSEKIQEGKFEIKKETLSVKEEAKQAEARNKIIDEMFHDLKNHPELDVADKVNFELKGWSEEEKRLAIKILFDRLHGFNERKNKPKKSKFRL